MSQSVDRDHAFIERLEKLVKIKDRGALAALRRGLGKPPGHAAEMHPYVLPWLPNEVSPWVENPLYLVASLFAYWHQGMTETTASPPENLGASFAVLRDSERQKTGRAPESVERRFVALLDCHQDDLANHLRHTIGLLRSKDVRVDWYQLLLDIRHWGWDSRLVQRNWARHFWGRTDEGTATKAEEVTV